ncbi:MAG: ester cyclase [Gemmatimonadota bacterium]
MQTLDDAWNAQDLDTFAKRHKEDVVVRWPGKPPTHGVDDHTVEAMDFFKTFPDQHLDNSRTGWQGDSSNWQVLRSGLLHCRPLG